MKHQSLVMLLSLALLVVLQVASVAGRQQGHKYRSVGELLRARASAPHRRHYEAQKRTVSPMHISQDMRVWIDAEANAPQSNTVASNRVSFRECNIATADRQDCGHEGITQEHCAARECCWGGDEDPTLPACYHSKKTVSRLCTQTASEKTRCGGGDVRKEQCLALGCCWQPISEENVPWCYDVKLYPVFEGDCGHPAISPNIKSRVVNGAEARAHSWPWQVSLQADGFHFCGGSLVNEQWVVSAAHCEPGFSYGSENAVVLGMHSLSGDIDDGIEPVRRRAELTIGHEDFNTLPTGLNDDILLIKLDQPVNFTDAIHPICLAELGQEFPAGLPCYTSGWGNLYFMGDSPDRLQQVQLPLVSYETCNQTTWYDGHIQDSMICAGYEEGMRGSCHGDSGGPMVCYDEDKWVLTGAVSWGFGGCAAPNYPTVFAKISHLRNWIDLNYSRHS